ncbi:ergothioneine biosynthesis protein EgtB [Reichenbachiella versicolor]|uniref:ergothioneine biosynthesis protein EgtB n=1 Tax=Reichenbachiella versicolor TaxID=1821036 RepID=UPI000D6E9E5A|nr:ergothioneine biosynthesis protein EgtB [Reichenbachiella versicolor]
MITNLLFRYHQIRLQSELICEPLEPEDYVVQPIVDVSPPKWHLGHTTWFFEQMLLVPFMPDYKLFHPEYNYVFNSYYETVGNRVLRTNRGNLSKPSVVDIYSYRKYVDKCMKDFIENINLSTELLNIIEIGLQHEQQHQELLYYDIKYILGNNPLFPKYREESNNKNLSSATPLGFLDVSEGIYKVGHNSDGFCFDNEKGHHSVFLHDYIIGDRLITNAEFLEFIQDGGYQDFRHWYSEAWEWVKTNDKKAPFHWHNMDGVWYNYTMHGLKKVNLDTPVAHVSQFEAAAFAKWKGMRLPTEFEWEVACGIHQPSIPVSANLSDMDTFEPIQPTEGNYQFYGDLWEWTSSAYTAYPYYEAPEGALGEYNGKFMTNQMVLKGGSYATPRNHIRPTYRNFFHPHLNWQFTGIRLAKHV